MPKDLAIDLGTANTSVYKKGKGIIVQEPSVVAYHTQTQEVLFTGNEALQMLGRTPDNVQAIRPLKEGAISDFDIAERLIRWLYKKAELGRFSRPRVLVCVPSTITPVERKALVGAVYRAGASEVHLINQPMAAAIGCKLNIDEPTGNMVIDIGGGTTEAIIVSLGEVVSKSALKVGSFKLDEAIQKYLKESHQLSVGKSTAEKIKMVLGSATPDNIQKKGEVRGMDIATSKPRLITLDPEEIQTAMEIRVSEIVESILECIRKAPPELSRDISKTGMYMVGGGGLLNGLGKRIAEAANVPVHTMSAPQEYVIRGAGICLEDASKNLHYQDQPRH